MKVFALSICTLLLFSVTACEDDTLPAGNDNPAVPENAYIWDNPHTSFFGLKGMSPMYINKWLIRPPEKVRKQKSRFM